MDACVAFHDVELFVVWTEEDDSSDRDSIFCGDQVPSLTSPAAGGLIRNAPASLSHECKAGRMIGR
jgi:hypothetical protein